MLPLFSDYTSLDDVRAACARCLRCTLSASRHAVVFGAGDPHAAIMLVGQGPSPTDDTTGLPYSGPAGDLLYTALTQAGLAREQVWITNLHKCLATKINPDAPQPEMRPPRADEIAACAHWLDEELFWVKPAVIVAIGGPAAETLLGKDFRLSEQHGQVLTGPHGIPTLATYQPTYLKRLNQWDRPAAVQGWRDLVADLRLAASLAA
jgi:uracil-DNA glycosylase family 4